MERSHLYTNTHKSVRLTVLFLFCSICIKLPVNKVQVHVVISQINKLNKQKVLIHETYILFSSFDFLEDSNGNIQFNSSC